MSTPTLEPPVHGSFAAAQKEYLAGFLAGIAQRGLVPYVGADGAGLISADPTRGGAFRQPLGEPQ